MAWLLIHNTGELQTVHMDKRQLVQVCSRTLQHKLHLPKPDCMHKPPQSDYTYTHSLDGTLAD
jgi:hypothetical protein